MAYIISQPISNKDDIGIDLPSNVDIQLNEETYFEAIKMFCQQVNWLWLYSTSWLEP